MYIIKYIYIFIYLYILYIIYLYIWLYIYLSVCVCVCVYVYVLVIALLDPSLIIGSISLINNRAITNYMRYDKEIKVSFHVQRVS